jgi:hypothetical protein
VYRAVSEVVLQAVRSGKARLAYGESCGADAVQLAHGFVRLRQFRCARGLQQTLHAPSLAPLKMVLVAVVVLFQRRCGFAVENDQGTGMLTC